MTKERTDYNERAAVLMGWELVVMPSSLGDYEAWVDKDDYVWFKKGEWRPLTDYNQLFMLLQKATKLGYDWCIAKNGADDFVCELDKSGKDIPKDEWYWVEVSNENLAKAVINAIWDAVHGE